MASAFERITGALSALGKRKSAPSSGASDTDTCVRGGKRVVFRPWDQQDMHSRLETYRPLTWFAKPDAVSPVECASRGWYNEARDQLCCEFCHARLIYPQNVPLEARQRAAQLFAGQLTSRHEAHCPWRSTRCEDGILAFNPSKEPSTATPAALQDSYYNRLAKLERLDQLPDVHHPAVQNLAAQATSSFMDSSSEHPPRSPGWGTDTLRRVLALPAPGDAKGPTGPAMPPAFDPAVPITLPASRLNMTQKARLLALLGWDAEELPAGSEGRPGQCSAYRPTSEAYTLAHLVPSRADAQAGGMHAGGSSSRWNMDNVVLNCPSCKSRVGLWNFIPEQHAQLLALPAPENGAAITEPLRRRRPDVQIVELDDDDDVKMGSDAAQRQPSVIVPLGRTIAGGAYDQSLSAAGAAFAAGAPGPVFGNPAAMSAPVYGLHAVASATTTQPAISPVQPVNLPVVMSADSSTGAAATAAHSVHKRKVSTGDAAASSNGSQQKRMRTGSGSVRSSSTGFDPLSHHRNWCPWIFTGSKPSGGSTSAPSVTTQLGPQQAASSTGASAQTTTAQHSSRCGWMHLLDSLSTPNEGPAHNQGPVVSALPASVPAASAGAVPNKTAADGGAAAACSVDMDVDAAANVITTTGSKDMAALKDSILSTLRSS